jgi:hypothetical protein
MMEGLPKSLSFPDVVHLFLRLVSVRFSFVPMHHEQERTANIRAFIFVLVVG